MHSSSLFGTRWGPKWISKLQCHLSCGSIFFADVQLACQPIPWAKSLKNSGRDHLQQAVVCNALHIRHLWVAHPPKSQLADYVSIHIRWENIQRCPASSWDVGRTLVAEWPEQTVMEPYGIRKG